MRSVDVPVAGVQRELSRLALLAVEQSDIRDNGSIGRLQFERVVD